LRHATTSTTDSALVILSMILIYLHTICSQNEIVTH